MVHMHPFFWFCAILALATIYGLRLKVVIGHVKEPLLHWSVAVVLVTSLVVGSFLATSYNFQLSHDATTAIIVGALFGCVWLGLRHWTSWRPWDASAGVFALVLVVLFLDQPEQYTNIILVLVALGMSVGGYYMTKRFLKAFFGLYAAFDIYMVWCSDLSEKLSPARIGPFPTALLVGRLNLPFMEISTLDVVVGAVAVVGIVHHRSWQRALAFSAVAMSITLAMHLGAEYLVMHARAFHELPRMASALGTVPFVAILAPLIWLFLRKPKESPSCS